MNTSSTPRQHRLLESLLLRHTSHEIPLDLGACAVALPHRPRMDIRKVRRTLDEFAREAMESASNPQDPEARLDAVRTVLFEKHGFVGNAEDYYSPENSLIDRVLETRRGIPISLSVVFIETARRAGVTLEGYGLPCHFVVGLREGTSLRLFDPFHGGEERTVDGCIEMVHLLSGGSVTIGRSDFTPAANRNILLRMLMNLRGIFRSRNEAESLRGVLEQLLMLGPDEASIHGELALHHAESGRLAEAHRHLECYTRLVGESHSANGHPAWVHRIRAGFSPYN